MSKGVETGFSEHARLTPYEQFVAENWTGPRTIEYAAIAMGGEAGEVLNEIKKEMRDNTHRQELVRDELGDTLHYLTHLARLYGYSLEDIMAANVQKLMRRDAAKMSVCGQEA